MYLALDDDHGHTAWGIGADALVASYLGFRNISYRAWRRVADGAVRDARGSALFIQGDQLRSENEVAVTVSGDTFSFCGPFRVESPM